MKNKIIQKAAELFISLGFKSVTMDEIAGSLGISTSNTFAKIGIFLGLTVLQGTRNYIF